MKRTTQVLLCLIVSLVIMASCITVYAEDNVSTIHQIAFIDEGVADQHVLAEIISRKMPVYIIENDSDGISQISDILSHYNGLSSISIYSKGVDGEIKLGTSFLNINTIDKYKEYIENWSNSITETADILFYACNAADSDEGKQLMNQISILTGSDVAASTNYTGTYGTDTDWELEYCAGSIETNLIDSSKEMNEYKARLDGTTRTWDGEGEDNNWNTAQNWSGDVVPDAYDIVVFDSTSTKDVYCGDDVTVYDFIIENGYTGKISGNMLTINNDFQMNGGNIDIYNLVIKGTTSVTAGQSLEGRYMYTYGDINIAGMENPIDMQMHICKGTEDTTTISGDFEAIYITFDDADHNYQINGNITISGNRGHYSSPGFFNNGNISINDGAKIDVSKCNYNYYSYRYDYNNNGIITENGTGRFYADANDLYFCNSEGDPILESSVGQSVFISLTDFDANLDKSQKETVTVTVARESDLNDNVTLTLTETENNSSVFRNLTGLELIATDAVPGAGQLKYDGTENLIAEYADSNSAEDTMSCKMDRDPIIWDCDGEDGYWYIAENWSTDTVPKYYDIVLFNNTSVKSVSQTQACEISQIVVDNGYTGEILFDRSYSINTKVYNDIVVKDGTITLNSNMTVNGDVEIQGGVLTNLPYSTNSSIINGDLTVSGGEFRFLGYYFNLNGDLDVSNGNFIIKNDPWTNSEISLYGNIDISGGTIDINRARIKSAANTITVNNINGESINELVVEENTGVNGNIGVGSMTLNSEKMLDINGTLTCYDSFINNGTINVADDAILDLRSVGTYSNNIISDNDTGKILYNAGGIGFVNAEGVPIGTANIGDKVYVELVDLSNNKSIYTQDTVTVTVSSQETGDTEVISLTETGINTSVFRSETGLVLIDAETEPVVGQLKYNGIEDLKADYTDDRDENDTISCNLHREPIIWDGGGTDNNWTTSGNWSTDTIPTRYDGIVLNGTSTKDIGFDTNIEMYELIVEESYTGEITGGENASIYVASDMTMTGGTINILGRFQTGGNLTVNGGSVHLSYNNASEHSIVGGNLSVLEGEVLFTKGYIDIKGNMSVVGGAFKMSDNSWEYTYIFVYGNVDLQTETNIDNMYIYGNKLNCSTEEENYFTNLSINTDGNVDITGEIKVLSFSNSFTATTVLSGEGTVIALDDRGSFSNSNVLNIDNGAVLNVSNYNYTNNSGSFYNYGQISESNGGKFYCDTKDMFFTNTDGDRIVFAGVGDEVFVRLIDVNLNKSGSIKEEVAITVESVTTGDAEDITLTETTNSSGIFTNASGLLLVSDELEPALGELKFNGTEDLEVSYTDSNDPNDVYTCSLLRDPLIWDGGGADIYWNTAENWSEDRVPDEYDRVVFNNTSSKNSALSWGISAVYSITIEESYQGVVKISSNLNVAENVTVKGAKLEISGGKVTAKGNLYLSGGIIEDNSSEEDTINGNVTISDGELKPYGLRVDNDFKMTGGKFTDNHWSSLSIFGDTTLTDVEEFRSYRLKIYGNTINISGDKCSVLYLYISTDGEVSLNGNINIVDHGKVEINKDSTLNLSGKIEFCEENSIGLENSGALNLHDNSILDLRRTNALVNSGTITISDTAKLYYDAEAMGVTDESGTPALNAFSFGDNLIVSLIDKNRNLDNSAVEDAVVMLKNWTNGDEETYYLSETGNNTCEFRGLGFATSSSNTATGGNNIFEGQDSDAFQIIYIDSMSDRVEYVVSKNCAELNIEGIDDLIVEGIDYGVADINGDSGTYTITLQNRGDIPLGIQEISLDNTDDFSFSEGLDISDILPNSARDIGVNFTPTSCGDKTANLTIKTNDNDEGVITIPLKGTGVESPVCSGIEDITVLQGTESYSINIFEFFEDAQDSDADLEYSIINNSNTSLVTGTVVDKVNGTLTLQFNTSQCGDSCITLRATDTSNAYIDEDFCVTVSECFTISGTVVDGDGTALEGATVKVMDFWDEEKCYIGATSADGTFSISFPRDAIPSWRKIEVSKAPYLKYTKESYNWGDEDLGTLILSIETDAQKAQRLADDLTEDCLGFQNGDCVFSVSNNLLLADTAGEESTIEWNSSNQDIISNLGVVTRPACGSGDVNVRMTATVHVNDQLAQREFFVMVIEAAETDEQKAQRLANDLTEDCLGFQNGDWLFCVSNDLLLADTAGEESTIEWSSSNQDVISNTGVVTRLADGSGDIEVRMTATVHVNDQSAQREFFVMVEGNTVRFDCGNIFICECETQVIVNVRRTGYLEGTASVDYTTVDDIAEAGSDYTQSTGTLTFLSGETNKTITLSIIDDDLYENSESFKLVLSNPTENVSIDASELDIEIMDNDPMPAYEAVGLCSTRYFTMEGESARIDIQRSNGAEGKVTVDYTIQNNTAQSGSDFIAASGTLEFGDGESIKTISIDTLDDHTFEEEESFKIVLSNATGGVEIIIPKANVVILDNDIPGIEIPSAPNLQSAVAGDGYVNLTWDTVPGSTGYNVYASTTSGAYGLPVTTVEGSENSCTVTELINDTTYYFVVRAANESGDSAASNEVSAMPSAVPGEPKTVPGEPTHVTATAGNGQAQVRFTAPTNDGGTPITGYMVTSNPESITATGADTTVTVTGLTNGTTYTFTVKAVNEVGYSRNSAASNAVTPYRTSSGENTKPNKPTEPTENGVDILVNGRAESAATSTTEEVDNKTVTTVTVDDKKVEEKLQNEENSAVVTIPVRNDSDVVVGQLNGQTVKNMETREAVLEIRTEGVTYKLPASQIDIDNVSSEIGSQVELRDITVNVQVSEPSQNTVRIVEDTAHKNNYQIVVRPIEFQISCCSGSRTVEVSKFNAYVERIIAIPDTIDASKITTGVVLNPDGSFSHVPTTIIVIDGKYYVKINSLTNSSYSVIYCPKSFKDVESHWAKDCVNDMASRLVIDGVGDGYFEPNSDVTRAEFTTIVVKALGLMRKGTGKDIFSDVTQNESYYDAVSIAYEYDIVSGYGNGKFGPMEKITREQAMAIIVRAMEITKLEVEFKDGERERLLTEFCDFEESADWARDSIASCIKAEIMFGRSGKTIAPKDHITRAEVAVVIRRLLQNSKLI